MQTFLKDRLKQAEEATQLLATQVLVCDEEHLNRLRMSASALAGACTVFEDLINLEYGEVVDLSEEEESDG